MSEPILREATVEEFDFDGANPNRGTERGRAMVRHSLERLGAGRSIVLDGNDAVIAGNKTLQAARDAGMNRVLVAETDGDTLVAVKRRDLDLAEGGKARELSIADNRSGEVGLEWSPEAIAAQLDGGLDLSAYFTGDELEELLAGLSDPSGVLDGADVDAIPEEVEPRCKLGEIWALGRHKLGCYDSTDPASVARLIEGKRVAMVWADPPFGINYTGHGACKEGRANKFDAIKGDGAVDPRWRHSCLPADGSAIYLKTTWLVLREWEDALSSVARLRSRIVWDKCSHVAGDLVSGYATRSEIVLFASVGKHAIRNFDTDVWTIARATTGAPENRSGHPYESPVELPARAIRNSSSPGDLILDPFCGSGSSILAAQAEGRVCYAIEIEPSFCDIALARWEAATGEQAKRVPNA